MKVAITGASGLVGSALCSRLKSEGHEIFRIVRKTNVGANEIAWDPNKGTIDAGKLEGIDAVVNLAGENIANKRWNAEQKKKIKDSRVDGTSLLARTLAGLTNPPKVLVSSSAIGFYGDRGSESLTEASPVGHGFLAEVCKEWEEASQPAKAKGIRVVLVRTGVALSTEGGALKKMLPVFQLGGGGIIGDGKQYMSWLSLDDLVGIFRFAIINPQVEGPVNAVSPHPVTNKEFTSVMGEVMHRPTIMPLPAFAAKMIMGEMAEELLLSSAKVLPTKLLELSYSFAYPNLPGALRHALHKDDAGVVHAT